MKSQDHGKRHVIALERGDDVIAVLTRYCKQKGIRTAAIQGIGAASEIVVGSYDFEKGAFADNTFRGNYEINSILGNISIDEGEPFSHIHVTMSDAEGRCFGGHLQKAIVSVTCEIFLEEYDVTVSRQYDSVTRRRLWKL